MGLDRPLGLGLLSTARISPRVIAGAAAAEGVEAVAVGGRDVARAQAFAAQHGLRRAHGSYEGLLEDPEVDLVYVALPNAMHAEWALRAVRAGKHVLVEKPLATDPEVVEELFDAARDAGVVVTEGLMWRHQPQVARLLELISQGAIGELRAVRAAFAFELDRPGDVRWDAGLGGGSLLDVGTYCVNAARLLAGEPVSAVAQAVRAPGGVDVRMAGVLRHPGDVLTTFACGFDVPYLAVLEATGAAGTVRLTDPWHAFSPAIEVWGPDGVAREEPAPVDTYALELEDLASAARDGREPLLGREDAVGQARALGLILEAAQMTDVRLEETTT